VPLAALQVSRKGGIAVTEDYGYVNQRWVSLPPLQKVLPSAATLFESRYSSSTRNRK